MAIQQRDQADREIVVLKAEIERLKGLLRNSGRNRERDALEIEQLKAELAKAMGQRKILNEGDSQ
jgi:uncharacterized small protein (DUF1192 family)